MNDQPFELILDECLDTVLTGERTIAACLDLYPDHADDLKPALQVGLLAARLKKPEMDATHVDALELRLRKRMPAPRREPVRANFAPLTRLAAMIAIVFLCALGTGGGVVVASANSLPGDTLYGVKRWWEAIILALSSLFDQTDDVWLHLAQMRLDEAEELAVRGIFYRDILVDVYDATTRAMTLADSETAPRVVAFLSSAETRLQSLPTTAATEPVRADLLMLVIMGTDDGRFSPALNIPTLTPSPSMTVTASPTHTPEPTSTATLRPTITFMPTSRVSVTPTNTPSPTLTPTPTITPSLTPTSTWTPLPLPVLPTSSGVRPPSNGGDSLTQPTHVMPTSDATLRYRATEAAVFATQTAQAAAETVEARP